MELYHVFSFILTYLVLSAHKETKEINDPLFRAIPSMKIPTGLLYTISLVPLIVLITNTDKFVYTEHVSVAISYYLLAKSMMYALGERKQEPLYHMGIGVISILMLIYAGVIPKDLMLIGYGLMAGMVYVSVGSRKTSSDLIFLDILLAHLLFYFSKRAVVNVS
jgi:hypothetical protein